MNPAEIDVLCRLREQLATAAHGEKKTIAERAARALGCSDKTLYRKLKKVGFDSKRKTRHDAGRSVLTAAELEKVAGLLLASRNNNGQRMPVATALAILRAGGQLQADVHESTVSRQLYQRRLHPEQLQLATPSVQMRSLHPNHVWQLDSTTGAYYYLPGGRLRWMPEDEFYKNKVANLVKASTDLLTRYCMADHTSHALKARYYLGGETAENLLDFVTWAMWKQDESPMHGVPQILVMDPGAANKGQLMRNFCKRVGIEPIWHAPGSARVTGSVEKAHDLVRMHFETRLRFVNPADVSLDWLNQLIARWAAAYCSEAKHSRHGATRYGKWMEIKAEQLRVAASLQALRDAAVHEPETRRVDNDKTISYGGALFDLALVPGVVAGLKVTLALNPFRAPAIDVLFVCPDTGEETWHVVEPVKTDANGYREGAPVWGQQMRTAAFSEVNHTANAMTRQAYKTGDGLPTLEEAAKARKAHAQAYAGVVDVMADVNAAQVPTYMPRRATALPLATRTVEAKRITVVAAARLVKARLGDAYTPQVFADLSARYADGVPEDQIDAIVAELLDPPAGSLAVAV